MSDEQIVNDSSAPAQDTPPAGGGDGGNWIESFVPEEYRDAGFVTKYTEPSEFFKGMSNLNELAGKKAQGLVAPGEGASEEERVAFDASLRELTGVPGTLDEYHNALELPEIEEGAMLPKFVEMGHREGIAPKAMQNLISGLNEEFVRESEAAQAASSDMAKKEMGLLQKEWGDDYDYKFNVAERFASELSDETLRMLQAAKWNDKATIVRDFARFGEQFLGEGELAQISRTPGGEMTKETLRAMMQDPRYHDPDKRDEAYIKKIRDGFKALHGEE